MSERKKRKPVAVQCGAKTRSGGCCKRAPAKGRSRCRLHGGATKRKHGLRSKDAGNQLAVHIEAARSDNRLGDIDELIARTQGALDLVLEKIDESDGNLLRFGLGDVKALAEITDKIASALKKKKEIAEGIKVRIFTEARTEVIVRLARWLREHRGECIDDALLQQMAEELNGGS